jgi:hypothetical protein
MARLQAKRITKPAPVIAPVVNSAEPLPLRPLTYTFKLKPVKIPAGELKYVGDEPSFPTDRVLETGEMARCYNWYSYNCEGADARAWLEQLVGAMPKRNHLIERYKKMQDWRFSRTAGWIARIIMRGGHVPYSTLRFLVRQLRDAEVEYQKFLVIEAQNEDKQEKPKGYQPTIQERMREKLGECLGEAEGMIDEFRKNGYKGDVKVFQLFKQFNIHQNQVNDIVAWAQPQLDEMLELQSVLDKKNRTDFEDQLVEGYSHLGKRQIKAVVEMWSSILDAAKSYGSVKKAERAPRKRKPVPPEKMVKKLKFLKKDDATGLVSIDPTKLIGASEVWVYNVKTRKIGIYLADDYSKVLSVKGASLLGFSTKDSRQKTLRKPETQLKEFLTLGKPAARKWLEKVKSTDIALNGRTNEHTILLRAYK